MAYLTYLASVPLAEVEGLKAEPAASLSPSLKVSVSHLVAYWVQVQPLGELLGQAMDGGTVINSALRHPLRDPCYHEPLVVNSLYAKLSEAWQRATAMESVADDDWYRVEI